MLIQLSYLDTEHESESGESNKISTGAIVGISVGIVLVAAATLIIFLG